LPDVDRGQVAAFWGRFLATGLVPADTPQPEAEPFGDSVELADELIALVVDGPKRATAGSVAHYELDGVPMPVVGGLSIATDGAGRARAVLRTTDVRVGPLSSVDDAFAWDEGEGDRSRRYWLEAHERYFRRSLAAAGLPFDPDMPTVFERFDVPYAE
jgi:uncharacterized protein YhfF